jgi:hypothetical protein
MEAGRQLLMLESEGSLNQPGHTGGGIQVSDVGFDRADGAELRV